jgi:hypothetical protein
MDDSATLELKLCVCGGDDFSIVSPVERLLVGSFTLGGNASDIPTLASVERVNGVLAQWESETLSLIPAADASVMATERMCRHASVARH